MNLNQLRDEIHQNAIDHGWWDEERSFGDIIALCHAELSEALEEYRWHREPDETYFNYKTVKRNINGHKTECAEKKPEGIPIELADTIIRILDYCGHAGIDIEEAIKIKHEYNRTRPYKHGGKRL